MEISARIRNTLDDHSLSVSTAGHAQSLRVSAKPGGRGSAVNGGELLAAALATCYCNDLYREADRLGIGIGACEVIATVQFGAVGQAATVVTYAARVESRAPADEVNDCFAKRTAWPKCTTRCAAAAPSNASHGRGRGIDARIGGARHAGARVGPIPVARARAGSSAR